MEMNHFSPPLRNTCWYGDALKPGERFWKCWNFAHNIYKIILECGRSECILIGKPTDKTFVADVTEIASSTWKKNVIKFKNIGPKSLRKNWQILRKKWAEDIKGISHAGKTKSQMALKYLQNVQIYLKLKSYKRKQNGKGHFFFYHYTQHLSKVS